MYQHMFFLKSRNGAEKICLMTSRLFSTTARVNITGVERDCMRCSDVRLLEPLTPRHPAGARPPSLDKRSVRVRAASPKEGHLPQPQKMPHTSRKKHQGPRKRLEVTDESGWTHVTKGNLKQKQALQCAPSSTSHENLSPTAIPRGLNVKDVSASFEKHMKIWNDSSCLQTLRDIFQNSILASNIRITSCVCLGLGSFTGGNFPETSFFELAALVSFLEILGEKHEIKHVYVQDPVFNSLDETFLRSLGYNVVFTPEAFTKIDESTFLFAPHLEWPVYYTALQNVSPRLCIGNNMQEYLGSPFEKTSAEARDVFRDFVDKYSSSPMPDFERSSWCESTSIYWLSLLEVDDSSQP